MTRAGEPQFVSVIVPCRNELTHVDAFLDGALSQVLPVGWRIELLVADGQSDDGTADRLRVRADQDERIRVFSNPGRIVSTGLNVCLARARGEIIVRMDVHTKFSSAYVAECIAALERTGADNVGGPWVARGVGAFGVAIAVAFQNRWVVGGARSRDRTYEGEVDTVYLGCWPRRTLARAGGFDETLVRNQDDEHNLRLRLSGGRVWQSSRIRSSYQARGTLTQLFRQQYQYGYWRPFVMHKHGKPGSFRQLVPAVFVASLLVTALLTVRWPVLLWALLAAYGGYIVLVCLVVALGEAKFCKTPSSWVGRILLIGSLAGRLGLVVPTYHLGYGLGTWRGLLDLALGRRVSGDKAKMTR
ncbi:glycosyltransferase family 2 protein [Ottowia sp. GY511]|uniref:Glycosyltransferase family 2 protein n=1 Tax=Ottowia flava TaxID=2675430 RepID=A0ABW4KUC2_9BURK|nr:glycosyltransferase family 2 protein [Ottowia sp. GY511]TXK33721.1 glycosyltransferase family 2 protein [Ottowia sp. GY511]